MPIIDPSLAWEPLRSADWSERHARHLLRRTGWTASPSEVSRVMDDGLEVSLARLFPEQQVNYPDFPQIDEARSQLTQFRQETRNAGSPDEKRRIQKQERDLARKIGADFALGWLNFAAHPSNSVAAKWNLFLSDVYVTSVEKVRNPVWMYDHLRLLHENGTGPAPALAKAVSRSPAMILYLDLQQSRLNAPNENFARELFELFLLGEGHYTENDIKEAARAFTGYRQVDGTFRFALRQHDDTPKTVFGHTGRFSGDNVIDLAFDLPAAGTFLPREMTRFYVNEEVPEEAFYASLGDWWKRQDYSLAALCRRFFGSRYFFATENRANYIKSPIQYYLGLLQDLGLDVLPLQRQTLVPITQMGQPLFRPPNVRGWVGGRSWINSATLAARRQVVDTLFTPLDEDRINADDRRAMDKARENGAHAFFVDDERLNNFAKLGADGITSRLLEYFLPFGEDDAYRGTLLRFLQKNSLDADTLRQAVVAVLQSPDYQLC